MVARPATSPSAGVLAIKSSSERRLRCAATASAPYSTKLPASTKSAMFSRAVRRPLLCRLATAAARPSSRVSRWRWATSSRSARELSSSTAAVADSLSAPIPVRVKTNSGSPVPTTWPAVTRFRTVRSAAGATSTCSIFIASSTTSWLPAPNSTPAGATSTTVPANWARSASSPGYSSTAATRVSCW